MMATKPKKGVAGVNTGGVTRRAIRGEIKQGATIKQIARAGNRSPSTIHAIKRGEIKNPPRNLAKMIRRAK